MCWILIFGNRQLERDHLQNELSEKNFETSKKVHQMLQHLIQAQAINEQTAEDLIHAHVTNFYVI